MAVSQPAVGCSWRWLLCFPCPELSNPPIKGITWVLLFPRFAFSRGFVFCFFLKMLHCMESRLRKQQSRYNTQARNLKMLPAVGSSPFFPMNSNKPRHRPGEILAWFFFPGMHKSSQRPSLEENVCSFHYSWHDLKKKSMCTLTLGRWGGIAKSVSGLGRRMCKRQSFRVHIGFWNSS